MKKAFAAALVALPMIANAGDPTGLWQTATNEEGKYLQVLLHTCESNGAQICGTIMQGFGGATQVNNGKPIIWDMQANGTDNWRRGRVWAPDDDKTYKASLTLSGDTLEVEGCVMVFCRSQNWTRVQ